MRSVTIPRDLTIARAKTDSMETAQSALVSIGNMFYVSFGRRWRGKKEEGGTGIFDFSERGHVVFFFFQQRGGGGKFLLRALQ